MTRFADPWLLTLLVLPLLVVVVRMRRRPATALLSSDRLVAPIRPTVRQRLVHLPTVIRVAALALLVVALARPQAGFGTVQTTAEGVAIEMVVDRSSSMNEATRLGNLTLTRFDAVKRVLRDFVLGDEDGLQGRPADLIGMVAFARYADTVCPLVRDHEALVQLADQTELVQTRAEDGTAIGDAIALAAARLKKAEEELRERQSEGLETGFTLRSKIIVLLTDGQSNAGDIDPMSAASLASSWGIKIYAVGIGGGRRGLFGRGGVDERTLTAVADATGGKYWSAEDANALRGVYREIDALEKSEIRTVEYTDYAERFGALAIAGLAALALEALLVGTVLRRIP